MRRFNLMVSVKDEKLDDLQAVVRKVADAGLKIDQVMESIGVVTGTIDEGRIGALKRVPGVAAVEKQSEVSLPPPFSRVQ